MVMLDPEPARYALYADSLASERIAGIFAGEQREHRPTFPVSVAVADIV
jgi:hypothetical protein